MANGFEDGGDNNHKLNWELVVKFVPRAGRMPTPQEFLDISVEFSTGNEKRFAIALLNQLLKCDRSCKKTVKKRVNLLR